MSDNADNQQIVADELMNLLGRYESIHNEVTVLSDDRKTLMKEIKEKGYNPKMFKQIIKDRQQDHSDFLNEIELLEQYRRMANLLPDDA